jgi:hypothetical protein
MKYCKQPHTRLHHTETHKHDDGSYRVEAHVIHRPPQPEGKNKGTDHIAYASPHDFDYPNKTIRLGASDWEEASDAHRQILEAHQHEGGHRKTHASEANDHDGDE